MLAKLLLLGVATSAIAQGNRVDNRVTTVQGNVAFGAQAAVLTVPLANVSVCAYPAIGSPCTNKVAIYSDQAMTQPAANPLTTDGQGRYGFWIAAGTYTYSATTTGGITLGTYPFTVGGSGSAVVSVNGQAGAVALTAASVGADPAGAASSVATAALQKNSNLSDISNPSIARANLGVGTATSSSAGIVTLATGQTSSTLAPVASSGAYTDLSGKPATYTTVNGQNCPLGGSCTLSGTTPPATSTAQGTTQLALGVVATQLSPLAGTSSADNAQTSAGSADGLANLITGVCSAGSGVSSSACDIVVSERYPLSEYSRYLTIPKDGNDEAYEQAPYLGGIGRSRFSEDRRLANRFYFSTNSLPLHQNSGQDRTPFVFESRITNESSYADNTGGMLIRGRYSGGIGNFISSSTGGKKNFMALGLDVIERGAAQGGGTFSIYGLHTSHGDWVNHVTNVETNGCSEGEDECDEYEREFLFTMTGRFGGSLNATPTIDTAGFGNYALNVTVNNGYQAKYAGERVFLVDLQNPYTAGNVTGILTSSYPGFARLTGDAAANWASQFGTSAVTNLVSIIDGRTYNGACPSTATGSPSVDPFITDENGIGGVTGFCATVGSTAGITAGQACTLAGPHSNIETVKVASLVDSTHIRLNVQNPHEVGEYLSCGGAQGYGISMMADDIAPNSIFNYPSQPQTTLHKVYPILASMSDGSLLVYTNEAKINDFSTKAYATTTPMIFATISSISTSGTAVTAINFSNPGDYRVTGSSAYSLRTASQILAAPTLTWSGCTTNPTVILTPTFAVGGAYGQGLVATVTNGGNCSSPSAALSTTWANPYRITPLVITRKVIDPSNGSVVTGHLLVSDLNPSLWNAGDTVEIAGWIHDFGYNKKFHGKYYTGASNAFGIDMFEGFDGNWAAPDTLMGFGNRTDGHFYWPSASQPIGPGIGYENPPSGYAAYGNLGIVYPIGYYPAYALFDVACTWGGALGNAPYHPCQDGISKPYNLFQMHSVSGESNFLRYDNSLAGVLQGLLSWTRIFQATSFLNTRGTPASSSETCATGESWDDANYHYHCVATNSIKRVALSAF